MAERISLRDYQRDLAARLKAADSGRTLSKLAVQAGAEGWLVDLMEAHATPVSSLVWADSQGSIGYKTVGRVPTLVTDGRTTPSRVTLVA